MSPGTLPNLADHVRIGFGERAFFDPGSNECLRVIRAAAWIVNDAVDHSVQAIDALTAAAVTRSSFGFDKKL